MFFEVASRDKSSPERRALLAPTNSRFLFLACKERESPVLVSFVPMLILLMFFWFARRLPFLLVTFSFVDSLSLIIFISQIRIYVE